MDNHYQVLEYKRSYNELVKDRTFAPLGRYKDCFYISKRKLCFKEEQDRINYELLGEIVADDLSINHTSYEPYVIKTTSREMKGLISKDYRIPNHLLIKFDKILELPKEVCSNVPKMIITGFDEIIIENFKGILEYEDFFVRISTYIGIINVNGYGLRLENMTEDDIKVTGKIESVDVERTIDE